MPPRVDPARWSWLTLTLLDLALGRKGPPSELGWSKSAARDGQGRGRPVLALADQIAGILDAWVGTLPGAVCPTVSIGQPHSGQSRRR